MEPEVHDDVRARIVAAGLELLEEGGRDAVTTREVATRAKVQAPAIYRLFGDKRGLLEAVAQQGLAAFFKDKAAQPPREPMADLRSGWDRMIQFGLAHPGLFSIISGEPRPGGLSHVLDAGLDVLRAKVHRAAKAGLLKVSEERAVNLIRASGNGTVLTLLSVPEAQRDAGLSVAAREGVLAVVTRKGPVTDAPGVASAAVALKASLEHASVLSPGERLLLRELLDKLAAS